MPLNRPQTAPVMRTFSPPLNASLRPFQPNKTYHRTRQQDAQLSTSLSTGARDPRPRVIHHLHTYPQKSRHQQPYVDESSSKEDSSTYAGILTRRSRGADSVSRNGAPSRSAQDACQNPHAEAGTQAGNLDRHQCTDKNPPNPEIARPRASYEVRPWAADSRRSLMTAARSRTGIRSSIATQDARRRRIRSRSRNPRPRNR
jgi:hypothetical protein